MTTALRDANTLEWATYWRAGSDDDSDLTGSYDSAEALTCLA